jgi:hypothetical protein
MARNRSGLTLSRLTFVGPNVRPAELTFTPELNVLFGASNTGKSFTVKSIDFMLGGSRELPDIVERQEFEQAQLSLDLPKFGLATLVRALAGGAFEFYAGETVDKSANGNSHRQLSARHSAGDSENLSQLLLGEIGLDGREIAIDANGKKRSLSFRDLARYCIVDETAIQSEVSPALSGQYQFSTTERSVFKLLITGSDDAAITPVADRRTFKAATAGKLEVVDELIAAIDEELASDFPNSDELGEQNRQFEVTWKSAQGEFNFAEESVRSGLATKRRLIDEITQLQERRAEIQINIGRFEQLGEIYLSDIRRLEAIEEAGFLLGLGRDRECPLCGASPESQRHAHGLMEMDKTRVAASAEIAKIQLLRSDLTVTSNELDAEGREIAEKLEAGDRALTHIESELSKLAPTANKARQRLEELLTVRDQVQRGLSLIEQRGSLKERRQKLESLRPASREEKPKLTVPSNAVHEFGQVVSTVLNAWQFPGKRHVSFDEATLDLRIDGKQRKDNGKGVRAITHAAFKVAMLLYCKERNLPHPGFLVLDTPLLTYRDPIHSKAGPLSADERELSNTSLKDFFFEDLSQNGKKGQFIVVENIDLPGSIGSLAHVETFTGDRESGRYGLFPLPTTT